MRAERGSHFLLQLAVGESSDDYVTIAGLKATEVSINGDAIVITDKGRDPWRALLSEAGVRSLSVTASGIYMGSAAEVKLRELALHGRLAPFQLTFESGEEMRAQFLVTSLVYAGDYDGERTYSVALESSGAVVTA